MKKIGGYPHNRYPTDMGTGTRRIFIRWIGYGGATTHILPVPLTSLVLADYIHSISYCRCVPIFHPHFWFVCFILSICVVVVFILFWICTKIRNVLLLCSLVFLYFSIYEFQELFCIYFDEGLTFFYKIIN